MHLKDARFVSLTPLSVESGHLRAVDGKIAWRGGASAVERGEEVLECWRQVILPGFVMADLDPLAFALRGTVHNGERDPSSFAAEFTETEHKDFALQLFIECVMLGVTAPLVNITNMASLRLRPTVRAAREIGLRVVIECGPDADRTAAADLGTGKDIHDSIRIVNKIAAPRVGLDIIMKGGIVAAGSILAAPDGAIPDALALVRALECLRPGLGFECLANSYNYLSGAFGAPAGLLDKGALFDILFLDYEVPGELNNNNIKHWILSGFSTAAIEAAVVAAKPVVRRHEVLAVDRTATAQAVASAVRRVAGGRS